MVILYRFQLAALIYMRLICLTGRFTCASGICLAAIYAKLVIHTRLYVLTYLLSLPVSGGCLVTSAVSSTLPVSGGCLVTSAVSSTLPVSGGCLVTSAASSTLPVSGGCLVTSAVSSTLPVSGGCLVTSAASSTRSWASFSARPISEPWLSSPWTVTPSPAVVRSVSTACHAQCRKTIF